MNINRRPHPFDDKTVLAYNWNYDARMLAQVCRKHDLAAVLGVPDVSGNCVMEWYAQFNGEWNDYYGNYRWKSCARRWLRSG